MALIPLQSIATAAPAFDIFREAASRYYGVPYDQVTAEQRAHAKREGYRWLYSGASTSMRDVATVNPETTTLPGVVYDPEHPSERL